MQFPLALTFKILALAQQATVTDAAGRTVCYVKQKLMKLREHVEVYADTDRARKLVDIRADRVIDFSARYAFKSPDGTLLGAVRRRGGRSIWRAHYEVEDEEGAHAYTIREANPWTKVVDSFVGEVPILGALTGYLFHPAYDVTRPDGTPAARLVKQPAFFEGKFTIEALADLPEGDRLRLVLGLLMMVMLERKRG